MITKLNTYEGVPLGTSNFTDFLEYIRGFLGANFGFSTNIIQNNGGYFSDDAFAYSAPGSPDGQGVYLFSPSVKAVGSLFGKSEGEYYRFEVINQATGTPQVNEWQVLATDVETESGKYKISNDFLNKRALPYKPVKTEDNGQTYRYGYYEVRFNGIPQDPLNVAFSYGSSSVFREQSVLLSKLSLGAEYPTPIRNHRYDSTLLSAGITLNNFVGTYNSEVEFPYTNFGIDYGGHIILSRTNSGTPKYVYVPQDVSSTPDPAPGTYKVIDASRGRIKLNISPSQMSQLSVAGDPPGDTSGIEFLVLSAEQLQENFVSGGVTYSSRYGAVYDGDYAGVVLLSYVFTGSEHIIAEVPVGDVSTEAGSVLVSDPSAKYGDAVMLALSYGASVKKDVMLSVQKNRYNPDTFQLYYSAGIIRSDISGTSNIRAMVEHNPTSWYNRDILDGDYFPVARSQSSWFSFLTLTEASSFAIDTFNPDYAFQIADTLTLASMADVPALNNGDVLVYNSSITAFDAVGYELRNLRDVSLPSSIPANNVLAYNAGSQRWISSSVSGALGFTPVNKAGDTGISGNLRYSSSVVTNMTGAPSDTLTTKGYVDSAVAGISGSGGALTAHMNDMGAHGATAANTADRIARRTPGFYKNAGEALLLAGTTAWDGVSMPDGMDPGGNMAANTQGYNLINVAWLYFASSAQNLPNRYVRRDSSGRARVASPSHPEDIANKGYVDSSRATLQVFTASGTWTKPSIGTMVFVQLWGAGAKGDISYNPSKGANGGDGGDYAELWIPLSSLPSGSIPIGVGLPTGMVMHSYFGNFVQAQGGGRTTYHPGIPVLPIPSHWAGGKGGVYGGSSAGNSVYGGAGGGWSYPTNQLSSSGASGGRSRFGGDGGKGDGNTVSGSEGAVPGGGGGGRGLAGGRGEVRVTVF
ncbi:MAG: hypothetical protein WC965_01860 [Thiohalomonadaceae bacterium]